jgi:uncharacterized protein
MLINSPLWNQLMIFIGEVAVIVLFVLAATAVILVVITVWSIKSGRLYFPRILTPELVVMQGVVKAACRIFGLDDRDLMEFFITIQNTMNIKAFEEIPVAKRAIFLPQCLRSSTCPATLTPEGIKCRNCGQCEVGAGISSLRKMGYTVFIVPGSSFIKRMVKKYRPAGIIGVGCIVEVKEGLEMCERLGLPAIGVVTLRDGCVETLVNWNDLCEVAALGIEPELIPADLNISAD